MDGGEVDSRVGDDAWAFLRANTTAGIQFGEHLQDACYVLSHGGELILPVMAAMLQAGENPATEAALVKSLGNDFEKVLPELIRLATPRLGPKHPLRCSLEQTLLHSPSFTIRGGTREILRGVIARGLGLR